MPAQYRVIPFIVCITSFCESIVVTKSTYQYKRHVEQVERKITSLRDGASRDVISGIYFSAIKRSSSKKQEVDRYILKVVPI